MRHKLATLAAILGSLIISTSAAQAHGVEMMTTRHGVFISTDMPRCSEEDGSGPVGRPCAWNLPTSQGGLSYWVGRHANRTDTGWRIHYVWPSSPVKGHERRAWVTREQARNLAKHEGHTARYWLRSYIVSGKRGDTFHSPNGARHFIRYS